MNDKYLCCNYFQSKFIKIANCHFMMFRVEEDPNNALIAMEPFWLMVTK